MRKMLLWLIMLLAPIVVQATEYGFYKKNCEIRYVVMSGSVNVRETPSASGKLVGKLDAGDVIYVDSENSVPDGDAKWIKFSGESKYVSYDYVRKEHNPNYVAPKVSAAKFNPFAGMLLADIPMWLIITVGVTALLLAIISTCVVAMNSDEFFFPPLIGELRHPNSRKYGYPNRDVYGEGMRQNIFFCPEPYITFLEAAGIFVASFIVAVLLFLAIGGLVWVACWGGSYLVYALFWILVVGGYGVGGLLLLSVFSSENDSKLLSIVIGAVSLAIAIPISTHQDGWYGFAVTLQGWGTSVFSRFNVVMAAVELVKSYWLYVLMVALAPLVIFIVCAAIYSAFAGILMLYEKIVMRRYNVKHPCPTCGLPSEPAEYYSHNVPLPVPLRPSSYGLFTITHPATSEKMPTLFLNGKDNLARKCPHCGSFINAKVGIEKHVAIAGVPASGKTTLLYRLISEMLRKDIDGEKVCRFTDKAGTDEATMQSFLQTISEGKAMTVSALKTADGRHKAIQLLVNNPKSLLPYRLFINDVAGELFTVDTSNQNDAVSYLMNTDVLILAVDPFTLKQSSGVKFSPKMRKWYDSYAEKNGDYLGKFDIGEAVNELINKIEKFRSKSQASKISLMFTFTKTDSGYLEGVDVTSSDALQSFAVNDLGLSAVLAKLSTAFRNISFHAVQAVSAASRSGVPEMMEDIFDDLDISFKGVRGKALKKNREEAETEMKKRNSEDAQKPHEVVHVDPDDELMPLVRVMVIVAVWAILIATSLFLWSSMSQHNVRAAENKVAAVVKQNPQAYSKVIEIYTYTLEHEVLKKKDHQMLEAKRDRILKDYKMKTDELSGILKTNFQSVNGRQCAVEISAKYGVMDSLKEVRKTLDAFREIAPNDTEYLKYEKMFNDILAKYNVVLQ